LKAQEKHRGGKIISLNTNTNGTKPITQQYTTINYSTKVIPYTLAINPSPLLETMKNDNLTTKNHFGFTLTKQFWYAIIFQN